MKQIRDLLKAAVPKPELMVTAEAQTILRDWSVIVGDFLATRVQPDRVVKGVLYVNAQDSAWAQEIQMHKEQILGQLNDRAGRTLFLDIRSSGRRQD